LFDYLLTIPVNCNALKTLHPACMGKCHELYPCLEQVQHSFTEYIKLYVTCLNHLQSIELFVDATSGAGTAYPSGENEFTQGFNGVHIARSLVFWGGGANPPLTYRTTLWTDISRASGILKAPVVKKFYWPNGPVNFFSEVDPWVAK
jgi:hypothetical protein